MAFIYFGPPEYKDCDESHDIFSFYEQKKKKRISVIFNIINEKIIKFKSGTIKVGITITYSICEDKCDDSLVKHNYYNKYKIHKWILLRVQLDDDIVYIDLHFNRTYTNWKDYLENNNLPIGIMFYPEKGYYDESKYLNFNITPASKKIKKNLKTIDKLVNTGDFISNLFVIGGIAFPIFQPIIVPMCATSVILNTYLSSRSYFKILDLKQHNQLNSTEGNLQIIDFLFSLFGTATNLGNGLKLTSRFTNLTKMRKSLLTIQAGTNILRCSTEILRISIKIKNNLYLTTQDFIEISLHLFIAVGTILPIQKIREMIKVREKLSILCSI